MRRNTHGFRTPSAPGKQVCSSRPEGRSYRRASEPPDSFVHATGGARRPRLLRRAPATLVARVSEFRRRGSIRRRRIRSAIDRCRCAVFAVDVHHRKPQTSLAPAGHSAKAGATNSARPTHKTGGASEAGSGRSTACLSAAAGPYGDPTLREVHPIGLVQVLALPGRAFLDEFGDERLTLDLRAAIGDGGGRGRGRKSLFGVRPLPPSSPSGCFGRQRW